MTSRNISEDEHELWQRIDGLIGDWIRIHLDLARAATGDMNAEERAQQKCLDHVQYLALAAFSSQLTPQILDAVQEWLCVEPSP